MDRDGDVDLRFVFNTRATGILCGDTKASLSGATFSSVSIMGTDSIETTGCK